MSLEKCVDGLPYKMAVPRNSIVGALGVLSLDCVFESDFVLNFSQSF